jgi:hypothetical protein
MRRPDFTKLIESARRLPAAVALLRLLRRPGWKARFSANAAPGEGHDKGAGADEPPCLTSGNLVEHLGREKDFLRSLVREMESEFLGLGEGLGGLSEQLGEIQKECQSLTDLTLDRTEDAAIQFGFQLLKKAEDFMLAGFEQYDHVFVTFHDLQRRLAQLTRQRDELMRILLPLNCITISFRIEASRHPREVHQAFSTLAEDVSGKVSEVRSAMERQFEELGTSERIARNFMDRVSSSIVEHRREVTATLETSREHLRALGQALNNSGAGAHDLAGLNDAVNRHIGEIVMALQCQDITSQKIEHVREAMEEMITHWKGADDGAARFVSQAAQIQLHQVQVVFEQLDRAAKTIAASVGCLQSEVGKAAEISVKIAGTTLNADVTAECQRGIVAILAIVRQAVQRIADILAAFEPLQASFVACTSKATELAGDVRRAGLNAQIFAINAPNGAPLVVLAGRVCAISDEVIQQAGHMEAELQDTVGMVNNLRERLEDFQQLSLAEEEVLDGESALSRKKLDDLAERVPLLIPRVVKRQESIARSLAEVLANIRFPAAVAEASSRSIGFFRALVERANAESAPAVEGQGASHKLDLLKSRYTMLSEHHAHAAALQSSAAAPGRTVTPASMKLFDAPVAPALSAASTQATVLPVEAEAALVVPIAETAPSGDNAAQSADLGANVELF